MLQLRAEGLSGRAIATSQGMSRKSVTAVLEAADAGATSWDDVAELPDDEVYRLLFPGRGEHQSVFAQPDWDQVHREMARVGVTLKLLHGEYLDACASAGNPAMGYDRFCKTYQRHVMVTGAASRVGHKAALHRGTRPRAGKRFSDHTRSGNAWLCGTLGDCATAAARTKNTYIAERHRRLQRRRGRKRAKVAISRTILESAWWVMNNDIDYADLGPEHFLTHARNPARRANRLTLELRALGYDITLPAPAPR